MANWLYCWELGGERGHLARMVTLAAALAARGDQVRLAVPDAFLPTARRLWPDVVAAPPRPPGPRLLAPASFAEILQDQGWTDAQALRARVEGWRALFDQAPRRLLFDFAPTAALAAYALEREAWLLGTGFYIPPDLAPMPAFRSGADVYADRPALVEGLVHQSLAQLLGRRVPERVAGVLHHPGLRLLLAGTPDFDHYGPRPELPGLGVFSAGPARDAASHLREGAVFAYLKPFASLGGLLDTLSRCGRPVHVHGGKAVAAAVAAMDDKALLYEPEPVAESALAGRAVALVNHGGHDGTCKALRAGLPVLALPLHPEQQMVARAMRRAGLGAAAPAGNPQAVGAALQALLEDGIEAAQRCGTWARGVPDARTALAAALAELPA